MLFATLVQLGTLLLEHTHDVKQANVRLQEAVSPCDPQTPFHNLPYTVWFVSICSNR